MKLKHLTLTVEQLRSIPDAERALFVLLAHALNEVNSLNKLLLLSIRTDGLPTVQKHGQVTQATMLARLLHGKLYEVWILITDGYFANKLGREYTSQLNAEGAKALGDLKKYFGPDNLVRTVRNQFAFHYMLAQAETTIPDDTPPEELAIYLHQTNGGSLYYFAEFLMRKALLDAVGQVVEGKTDASDDSSQMDQFLRHMSEVVAMVNLFSQSVLLLVIEKFIGRDVIVATSRDLDIGQTPKSDDAQIPFFFEVSPYDTGRGPPI